MGKNDIIRAIDSVQAYIDEQFEAHGKFVITEWVIATDKKYEISRIEQSDDGIICVVVDFILCNGLKTWKLGRYFRVMADGTVR